MVEPGATADGFDGVEVTVTANPGDRLSTYACNCAAVPGLVLVLPRTEAPRAPSCARLDMVLYCHTARPNWMIPKTSEKKSTEESANSTRDWPSRLRRHLSVCLITAIARASSPIE